MMKPITAVAGFATAALSMPVYALAEAMPPDSTWGWVRALSTASGQFVLAVVCVFFALAIVYLHHTTTRERDKREDRLVTALESVARAESGLQVLIQECHNRTLNFRKGDPE